MKQRVGMLSLALAWSVAAGCSDSDKASEADYDDVAQALSVGVATNNSGGDIGSLQDSASIAVGTPTLGITVSASGEFVGNRLGVDYDYSVACSDAAGTALDRCGANTDSAKVAIKWSGELAIPNLSASVARDGHWDLSEIQSGTVQVDGDGHFDLDVQFTALFRDVTRHYSLSYDATYDGVQVRRLPAGVVGGTVSYSVKAERMASGTRGDSEASFDMDAALTFGSNASAMLTLDGKYQYAVDTSSGQITKMGTVSASAKP
jgi:hypothetical protein